MPCRVADLSQSVRPVLWRSVASPSGGELALSEPQAANIGRTAGALELTNRLGELERTQQADLAQVRQEAFQQGIRQAQQEAAAQVKASAEQLAQTLSDLASLKRRVRNEAEAELVKLSLAIARRILRRELATDPEAIHGLVHAAMQKLQNREISRVRVCPAGADAVRSCLERLGAAPAIHIVSDSSLKSGDLIFETQLGDLDVSIDTQLQEIQRGLADRLSIR